MDKFEFRDYTNYILSGLIWLLAIAFTLNWMLAYLGENQIDLSKISENSIVTILGVIILSYILGNILRPTEIVIKRIVKLLYGDIESKILFHDREKIITDKDNKKLGILYLKFNKKNIALGKELSRNIEDLLRQKKIWNGRKKTQIIMLSNYLDFNLQSGKVNRLNDLKNFYESIYLPLTILMVNCIYLICKVKTGYLIPKIIMILVIVYANGITITRYKYLRETYLKTMYRTFFFYESKNSNQ